MKFLTLIILSVVAFSAKAQQTTPTSFSLNTALDVDKFDEGGPHSTCQYRSPKVALDHCFTMSEGRECDGMWSTSMNVDDQTFTAKVSVRQITVPQGGSTYFVYFSLGDASGATTPVSVITPAKDVLTDNVSIYGTPVVSKASITYQAHLILGGDISGHPCSYTP